ncbi:hypothetical protein [Nocardioides sp.]|uniref:hypothetical protein n=1 Tax=Nocardioides sp. TaxID=35761 RepID=UPI002B26CDD1|nr:hypothetical protein [Nocardioides sp.]
MTITPPGAPRALLAASLVGLALGATPLAPASSASATAPAPQVSTLPVPGNPLKVAAFDETAPPPVRDVASLTVRADEGSLADVTATVVESEGLYVDPMVATFPTIARGSAELVRYAVRGTTTGLHTLTFEVTAAGAEPQRVTLPYVWRPGGAPIDGGDSLAGRLLGVNGLDSFPCGSDEESACTFRYSHRLAFLDDARVSRSLGLRSAAACTRGGRCPRYWYDEESGLVQVGWGTIGRLTDTAAFVGGERYVSLTYPGKGRRLSGRWLYGAHVDEGRGVVEQLLTLRKTGRFRLRFAVDTTRRTAYGEPEVGSSYGRTLAGSYAIGRNGRLALRSPRRDTTIATLALVTDRSGRPSPGRRGVWLDQTINPPEGGSFVDGNRLNPLG